MGKHQSYHKHNKRRHETKTEIELIINQRNCQINISNQCNCFVCQHLKQ